MYSKLTINKKILILLLVGFIVCVCFIKLVVLKNNKSDLNSKRLNVSLERIQINMNKNILNRMIKKMDGKIFIGENEKQIENNYYDIKVTIENNEKIMMNINKLWKEFDEKLYQEEYVVEIVNSISDILEMNDNDNKLFDYIISGYSIAKNSNNKEELDNKCVLELDSYRLEGKVEDKEFVVSIYLNN